MPVLPTYPGVYIEELDSGVRTITGVATSVTAFVGMARKGPTDKPIEVFSFGDYERTFGGLWNKSTMSFAVRDFFLNGGGVAVIVRVHNDAQAARIRLPTGKPSPDDEIVLVAENPGTWGDYLSVKIDYETRKIDGVEDPTLFNVSITEKGGLSEKFFNVTLDSTKASYLPRVLEQESVLMRVDKNEATETYKMPADPLIRPAKTGIDKEKNDVLLTPEGPLGSPPFSPPGWAMSPPGSPLGAAETGSSDGLHITANELVGENFETDKKGLYALENTDIFNLLCIPPFATNIGAQPEVNELPTDVDTGLISIAVAYCEKRRAMLLVDPHSTWNTMSKAKDQFSNLVYPKSTSKNAALFFRA